MALRYRRPEAWAASSSACSAGAKLAASFFAGEGCDREGEIAADGDELVTKEVSRL